MTIRSFVEWQVRKFQICIMSAQDGRCETKPCSGFLTVAIWKHAWPAPAQTTSPFPRRNKNRAFSLQQRRFAAPPYCHLGKQAWGTEMSHRHARLGLLCSSDDVFRNIATADEARTLLRSRMQTGQLGHDQLWVESGDERRAVTQANFSFNVSNCD